MSTKYWIVFIYEIVWIPNSKKEKKRKKTLDDLPIMLDEDQQIKWKCQKSSAQSVLVIPKWKTCLFLRSTNDLHIKMTSC